MKISALGASLLFLFASSGAWCQEQPIPSNFFIEKIGPLENTTKVNKLSNNNYIIWQIFPLRMAQQANFMSFCIASKIAKDQGFNGFAMKFDESKKLGPNERFIVTALINDTKEIEGLPSGEWTEFLPYKGFRQMCSQIVNPEFMWHE